MILTLFLSALETIINLAIKADPDALRKIATLKNQVIEIHCDDWRMHFFIMPSSHGLQFHTKYTGKVNTTITGSFNHFLHIFIKGADTKTLFNYPIDVEGNTHNIEVLRDAFKNIDIDFEEKLSHYVGDSIAHKLCFHLKNTRAYLKKSAQNIENQTKEYIHYETKNLVSHKQAERFYEDVTKLRDDVERLEARMLR